jgi:hypothetical protein
MFKESYVVDESGNRIGVLLDLHTYQKLLAAAREVEILRAATTQVNHNLAEEPISAENDLEKFIVHKKRTLYSAKSMRNALITSDGLCLI